MLPNPETSLPLLLVTTHRDTKVWVLQFMLLTWWEYGSCLNSVALRCSVEQSLYVLERILQGSWESYSDDKIMPMSNINAYCQ